jgi:hypothetical protein
MLLRLLGDPSFIKLFHFLITCLGSELIGMYDGFVDIVKLNDSKTNLQDSCTI